MSRIVVLLDAGPLGLATNPKDTPEARSCRDWLWGLLDRGAGVAVPEIADYEVRRELIRAGRTKGVARLDDLIETVDYLPLTTAVMRLAAELWASARGAGRPTAADASIDADVILAAQARLTAEDEGLDVVVATTNAEHMGRYVHAANWASIVV